MKLKNDNAGRFGFFPFTWFAFSWFSRKLNRAVSQIGKQIERERKWDREDRYR